MSIRNTFIGLFLLGVFISSCATSGPSTLEVMDTLETEVNEKDMEGVMALFAKDAVLEESYEQIVYEGTEEIEMLWNLYFYTPFIGEFRDISVDGDTATFTWAEEGPMYTKLWPVVIEVQNGKITYMDFFEDATLIPAGDE